MRVYVKSLRDVSATLRTNTKISFGNGHWVIDSGLETVNDVLVPAFYVKSDLTDRNGLLIVYLTDSITLTAC